MGEDKDALMISGAHIKERILTVRGQQVMLDRDLAGLYEVENRVLNQAVRRNSPRFPEYFRFQLTAIEFANLRSQIVISSAHGGRRYLPYAFTEQGIAMLSAVLRSEIAIKVSIQIMEAFVEMRRTIACNKSLVIRVSNVEQKLIESDRKFDQIFKALDTDLPKGEQGIFFDGQVFDARVFVSDLIKSAKTRIVLIDNYIDESVLHLLTRRQKSVVATVYTKVITSALRQDLALHNQQYSPVVVNVFARSHDRFLIIDDTVYHFGASLKDLGKKWFDSTPSLQKQ